MKNKLLVLAAIIMLTFSGCSFAHVESVNDAEKSETDTTSMFVEIEKTACWKVVYHRDTKVMYVCSYGSYNCGTFTVMVNPDGTPMIWEDNSNECNSR